MFVLTRCELHHVYHAPDAHLAVRAPKPCALGRQPARIRKFAPPTRQHEAKPKLVQHLPSHCLWGNRRPEAKRASCTADDSDCLWVIIERSSLDLRSVPMAARPSRATTENGSTVVGPCVDENAADNAERNSRETFPSLLDFRAGSCSDIDAAPASDPRVSQRAEAQRSESLTQQLPRTHLAPIRARGQALRHRALRTHLTRSMVQRGTGHFANNTA